MKISFSNDYHPDFDTYQQRYRRLAKKTMEHLTLQDNYLLEVNLVDNDTIHQINRDYRHIDRPTDVISFAFNDEVEGEVHIQGAQTVLLGTILISVDKAKIQAEAYGHSLDRELKFLFIHGLLHLLGYDHQNSEEEKEMFQLQEDILGKRVK